MPRRPSNAGRQAPRAAGAQRTLYAVACTPLIRIEAPFSAYRGGLLVVGDSHSEDEEEPFYVATAVKRFLSPLRARRSLLLRRPNDLSGLRPC
jgi:hypothetical protein